MGLIPVLDSNARLTKVGCQSPARTTITHKLPIRSTGLKMCQLTVSQLYGGVTFHPPCRFIRIGQVFLLTRVRLLWRRRAMISIHPPETWEL